MHVLAATIWVGGQFTVAGLVPTAKKLGEDAPKQIANAFARIMWPAFAVLLITGSGTCRPSRRASRHPGRSSRHQDRGRAALGPRRCSTAGRRAEGVSPSGAGSAAVSATAALVLGVFLAG